MVGGKPLFASKWGAAVRRAGGMGGKGFWKPRCHPWGDGADVWDQEGFILVPFFFSTLTRVVFFARKGIKHRNKAAGWRQRGLAL